MDIKTVKDLAAAIRETGNTTKSYDTTATVTRIDGGTAWVHIPGGVDETPVQLSINAKKGDTVNVRVSGGRAWITGNATAPPTDDTKANIANRNAMKALKQIKKIDSQVEELEEINYIVEDTIHYLATDQDEGVTIETQGWTEEPQFIDETNRYLWIYHTYTLANGNTVDTDPVIAGVYGEEGPQGATGATGATGDTGATGKGISSVQPQYRLSTSSTSLVGGSWSTSLVYSSGYYIWTREKITYDDGTSNYSTAIYDEALTTACSLASNTAQYFWVNDTGTTAVPTGAYVTETPQDSYKTNPTLGSILLRSAGIYIRYAAQTIAQFLSSGLTLFSSAGYKLASFLSTGVTLYAGDANDTEVATFSGTKIELAKNSDASSIEFCGGRAVLGSTRMTAGNQVTLKSNLTYNASDPTTQNTEVGIRAVNQRSNYTGSVASIYCSASSTNNKSQVNLFGDDVKANGSEVVTQAYAAYSNPVMDGAAAKGSSVYYARQDHVHPSDTTRVPTTRKINNNALSADLTLKSGYSQLATGSHKATAADTWEYTGVSFTITESVVLYIRTNTSSARKRPTGLGLHSANTLSSGNYPDEIAYTAEYAGRTPIYWVPSGTYYVYQKRAAAGTAEATITVNRIIIE